MKIVKKFSVVSPEFRTALDITHSLEHTESDAVLLNFQLNPTLIEWHEKSKYNKEINPSCSAVVIRSERYLRGHRYSQDVLVAFIEKIVDKLEILYLSGAIDLDMYYELSKRVFDTTGKSIGYITPDLKECINPNKIIFNPDLKTWSYKGLADIIIKANQPVFIDADFKTDDYNSSESRIIVETNASDNIFMTTTNPNSLRRHLKSLKEKGKLY